MPDEGAGGADIPAEGPQPAPPGQSTTSRIANPNDPASAHQNPERHRITTPSIAEILLPSLSAVHQQLRLYLASQVSQRSTLIQAIICITSLEFFTIRKKYRQKLSKFPSKSAMSYRGGEAQALFTDITPLRNPNCSVVLPGEVVLFRQRPIRRERVCAPSHSQAHESQ